jgi:hypothetical protein
MKLKTFTTHTRALIQDIHAIELEFNVWASDNKDKFEIIRTDYSVQKRIDHKMPNLYYEEIVLFVFYNSI